jgi:hypothetical protein
MWNFWAQLNDSQFHGERSVFEVHWNNAQLPERVSSWELERVSIPNPKSIYRFAVVSPKLWNSVGIGKAMHSKSQRFL